MALRVFTEAEVKAAKACYDAGGSLLALSHLLRSSKRAARRLLVGAGVTIRMIGPIPRPEEPERVCNRCSQRLPVTCFVFYKTAHCKRTGRRYRVNHCRRCRWEMLKKTKAKRADHYRRMGRAYKLASLFGMTWAEYDAMHARQGGVCAICRRPETRRVKGTLSDLCVDHCHATGRVRGLLCQRCNMTIGLARDEAAILRAAAEYIDASRRV
jgi:hypothetical protein